MEREGGDGNKRESDTQRMTGRYRSERETYRATELIIRERERERREEKRKEVIRQRRREWWRERGKERVRGVGGESKTIQVRCSQLFIVLLRALLSAMGRAGTYGL